MTTEVVGKLEALYDELSALPPPEQNWIRSLHRRQYSADYQLDPQDAEKVLELYDQIFE